MKYTDQEYAIFSIDSSFLENTKNIRMLEEWSSMNLATLNIIMNSECYPNHNFLKRVFHNGNINYQFEINSISLAYESNYLEKSFFFDYEDLDLISSMHKDLVFSYSFSFITLSINMNNQFEIDIIEEFISRTQVIVILDPYFKNKLIDLENYSKFIEWIYKSPYENIRLSNKHIHTNTLRLHPCNISACTAHQCHMKKTCFLKDISITKKGEVLLFSQIYIGNLNSNNMKQILESCHKKFLSINKDIFTGEILNYCYDFFPWRDYFFKYWEKRL